MHLHNIALLMSSKMLPSSMERIAVLFLSWSVSVIQESIETQVFIFTRWLTWLIKVSGTTEFSMAAPQLTFASVSPQCSCDSLLSDSSEERKEVPSHMAAFFFPEEFIGNSDQKL